MACGSNIMVVILVIVLVVMVIQLFQTVYPENFGSGYVNRGGLPEYARLGGNYNARLFSPCMSKSCSGGEYAFSNDPYEMAWCQTAFPGVASTSRYGLLGRPMTFDYSNLTNNSWLENSCNSPQRTSLCTL